MKGFEIYDEAIEIISSVLNVSDEEISDLLVLKKGMTNHSVLFTCKGQKYILRMPGEGTSKLINRKQEYDVYAAIGKHSICDEILYINPESGYKISRFWDNARVCNPKDPENVRKCMEKLREFHNMKLQVGHTFDIFEQISFYQNLWDDSESCFKDYEETKAHVFRLKEYVDSQDKHWVLAHIDAVPDNFLFVGTTMGEDIRLIDWEYAGMQDACVDIAMFAIYAMYDEIQVEQLIDMYYPEGCKKETRLKIYCYIAAGGLLWSNWCEYKRKLGVEFGEYSVRQYEYAKRYYEVFMENVKDE